MDGTFRKRFYERKLSNNYSVHTIESLHLSSVKTDQSSVCGKEKEESVRWLSIWPPPERVRLIWRRFCLGRNTPLHTHTQQAPFTTSGFSLLLLLPQSGARLCCEGCLHLLLICKIMSTSGLKFEQTHTHTHVHVCITYSQWWGLRKPNNHPHVVQMFPLRKKKQPRKWIK